MQNLWSLLSAATLLGSVGCSVHLLLRYRQPSAAVAWLFALWALPFLGALLYLGFAVYEGPRTVRRRRRLSLELRAADDRFVLSDVGPDVTTDPLARRAGGLPITHGNQVGLHASADAAREAYFAMVRGAKSEILVQTYIWSLDSFTRELVELLGQKVREGLRVRVLIDPLGSHRHARAALRQLGRRGIDCAEFLPPTLLKRRLQVNFRNHRKALIADGSTAFVGGRNLSDRNFDDGREGVRDLSFTVEGPAVGVLRRLYLEDWFVATERPDRAPQSWAIPEARGTTPVRVIPHGCDEEHDAFLPIVSAALRRAKMEILVVTPYFVPGPVLLHDLRMAALDGIRVRILVPKRSPERWPDWAAGRCFPPLLEAGVEIWVRRAPFLHAKAIVVDEHLAIVGTANFDQRSFHLNYEVSFEVPDSEVAGEIVRYFELDFAEAERIDPAAFARRGWMRRARENAAALFSPML